MPICPHCGQSVREDYSHCPFCGTEVSTVWPPRPAGQEQEPPPDPEEIRKKVREGAGTGCIVGAGIYLLLAFFTFGLVYTEPEWKVILWHAFCYGVPLLTLGLWHLLTRRPAPYFARGLIYSLLGILACLLGALVVCREPPH
jgi:hypothetical protein